MEVFVGMSTSNSMLRELYCTHVNRHLALSPEPLLEHFHVTYHKSDLRFCGAHFLRIELFGVGFNKVNSSIKADLWMHHIRPSERLKK